jgi:SAM-dependent methyltransferase
VGDAEELPFPDDSFDVVATVFGAIFAPRHERAAAEMLRVAKPGGTVAVTAWTPDGANGQMFKTLAGYMPPPPPEIQSPTLWGDEEHVRGLFPGAEVEFLHEANPYEFESLAAWIEYIETTLGPVVLAKAALEAQGRWDEARADLERVFTQFTEADDGTMRGSADYLVTLVRKPS